jgi:xylulokinase
VTAAEPYVLGIDLGTSGPKVALIGTRGTLEGIAFEPTGTELLPGGGAEQNPITWWRAITQATRRLLTEHDGAARRVRAIGVTGQWSGTVGIDRQGIPVTPAVIWMDSRGAPMTRARTSGLVRIFGYAPYKAWRWIRLTGGAPGHSGKDSLSHMLFIKEANPEAFARVDKFLEPKDYINFKLTGERVATFDSIALTWVTDNRDPHHVRYHSGLLSLAGIDREKLPDLSRATDVIGKLMPTVADELGLPAGIAVVGGAPDVHAAAIGSGAVKLGQPHLYIGSSGWLSCHVPRKKTDLAHNMAALPAALPGRYLLLNEQTAGACLNYLRDRIFCREDELRPTLFRDAFEIFDKLAAIAPIGSERLIFTPWLYGERTPIEDRTVRAGFYNLSLAHGREHLIRAVLEGVAYNTRWLFDAVESFIGKRIDTVRIVGGGAKSDLWCQIFADVLGVTIERVEAPLFSTVRGAGLLALLGIEEIDEAAIPDCIRATEAFQPRPDAQATYRELQREFVGLYRRNRAMFERLNR